jgi:uncharacterized protein (TIGR00299 family) protein
VRIAYFDCVGGASGDMFLGALLDAGGSRDTIEKAIGSLGIAGVRIEPSPAIRHGIGGLAVRVIAPDVAHERHLPEIEELIGKSALTPAAKDLATSAFRRLAEAEAQIHRIPAERVHFHEVGALDAIADVVGTVVAFESLGIERAYHSPVPFGSGSVQAAHGVIPLPGPAALHLLRGRPVKLTDVPFERTTPTGAALLATLATPAAPPSLRVTAVGHGCGARDPKEVPNFLRVIIGETDSALLEETLLVIETNVDDMNPQAFEPVFERVLGAGALDFFVTPVVMKKGRPAHVLTALVAPDRLDAVTRALVTETPSLGVRIRETRRLRVPREERVASTPWGPVRVKVALLDGGPLRSRPEYDDCLRIARETGLPFIQVYEAVLRSLR